jgi:hypothetical protein
MAEFAEVSHKAAALAPRLPGANVHKKGLRPRTMGTADGGQLWLSLGAGRSYAGEPCYAGKEARRRRSQLPLRMPAMSSAV